MKLEFGIYLNLTSLVLWTAFYSNCEKEEVYEVLRAILTVFIYLFYLLNLFSIFYFIVTIILFIYIFCCL